MNEDERTELPHTTTFTAEDSTDYEIWSRLCHNDLYIKEQFSQYINFSTLVPCLKEEDLIDYRSKIANEEPSTSDSDRIDCLLDLLKEGGPETCGKFVQALEKEDEHLGHRYILDLIRGHKYADEEEIALSSRLRKRIAESDMTDELLSHVNLKTNLVGRMYNEKLITEDELEMLGSCFLTSKDRKKSMLKILHTKGPLAFLKFIHCLQEDSVEQETHLELFRLICNGESVEIEITSVCRKRKARESEEITVTKRVPIRLEIEGELVTEHYLSIIQNIRLLHNKGQWDEVDKLVKSCEERSADFFVAVLLESCTGFITCELPDKVEETVKKARKLCSKITNNCNTYLRGRCEWTLAKLYRYTKENDKALEHIIMARHIQYNIKAGEDTALSNYCYACILLESLANKFDPYKDKEAKRSLELAIEHASSGDFGLDVAHPKIRLAQLYLGSSPQSPGTKTDDDSLKKAQSSLESVGQNLQALAIRTQCIYYYTESDLHRNSGEIDKAIHSAQTALDIAKKNNFSTEDPIGDQVMNSDLYERLKTHQDAIEQNLNLSYLIPYLYQNGIISDLESGIADDSRPSQDRIRELISLITENDTMVCKIFLEVLDQEDQHLGHRYIWCLLMNQKYADEEDISTSSMIQARIKKNTRRMEKGMNLEGALIEYLFQKKLLTVDEFERLTLSGNKSNKGKNQTALRLLHSKGPTAHLLFAQCLKEASLITDDHCAHEELFQLIVGESTKEVAEEESSMSRKRKLEDYEQPVSVKRGSSRLAIEGGLKTVEYLEVIKKMRQYHNQGKWKAVEDIVQQSANRSIEVHVAVLLESCTGLIIQKQRDSVLKVVARARELCSRIDNNCETYLRGRCEYTMARMHQYANENDKALKFIMMARHTQYNVEFGEDTALTNYCYGCILLECLTNSTNSHADAFEIYKEAESSLEYKAIMPYDKNKIYGLNVAHPKIRLAQLHLGSSSCFPGTMTDSKRLKKAQYYLEKAAEPSVNSLAPRTQCIYYYTQSDLHRNKGHMDEARSSAQKALAIAVQNKFTTEIESANARLFQTVPT